MSKWEIRGTIDDDTLLGTNHGESIYGFEGNDQLEGAKGNDRLIGGDGGDTFIFKPGDGRDSIIDFQAIEGDKINLSGFGFTDITDVKITSSQGNTTISFGKGDSILLFGVDGTTLTNGDFIFS